MFISPHGDGLVDAPSVIPVAERAGVCLNSKAKGMPGRAVRLREGHVAGFATVFLNPLKYGGRAGSRMCDVGVMRDGQMSCMCDALSSRLLTQKERDESSLVCCSGDASIEVVDAPQAGCSDL